MSVRILLARVTVFLVSLFYLMTFLLLSHPFYAAALCYQPIVIYGRKKKCSVCLLILLSSLQEVHIVLVMLTRKSCRCKLFGPLKNSPAKTEEHQTLLMAKGSVGSFVNHTPPWHIDPCSRDQRMFNVLCFKHQPHSQSWEQFCILLSDNLAWHFFNLPIFFSSIASLPPFCHSKEDLWGNPLLHLLNHFKHSSKLFSPKAGTQTNGIIWAGDSVTLCLPPPALSLLYFGFFFFCRKMGKTKGQGHWSASLLAELNRGGPFHGCLWARLFKNTHSNHIKLSPFRGFLRYQDSGDDGRDGNEWGASRRSGWPL